jgi:hypothetical protein
MASNEPKAPVAQAFRRNVISTVLLFLVLVVLGSYAFYEGFQSRRALAREVNKTTRSLCALRADYQIQIDGSRDFLHTHPEGIPGITAALIQKGIRDRQHTVEALRFLTCPPQHIKP